MAWLILVALLTLALSPLFLPERDPNAHRHEFGTTPAPDLAAHACGPGLGYCRHRLERCACGKERITGYFVEEVR